MRYIVVLLLLFFVTFSPSQAQTLPDSIVIEKVITLDMKFVVFPKSGDCNYVLIPAKPGLGELINKVDTVIWGKYVELNCYSCDLQLDPFAVSYKVDVIPYQKNVQLFVNDKLKILGSPNTFGTRNSFYILRVVPNKKSIN